MTDDVTVFFPGPPFPAARAQGRVAAQNAFAQLFAQLRQRGTRTVSLQPVGLAVQLYGDTAIATFHLMGQQEVGRRTLVLRRVGARWLVAHMHASVAPMQQRPAAARAPARAPATPARPPTAPPRR
jgi:ketosteroid isomerase-like protein